MGVELKPIYNWEGMQINNSPTYLGQNWKASVMKLVLWNVVIKGYGAILKILARS